MALGIDQHQLSNQSLMIAIEFEYEDARVCYTGVCYTMPLGLDGKDLVGTGSTAIVARLDAVVKFSRPSELHKGRSLSITILGSW